MFRQRHGKRRTPMSARGERLVIGALLAVGTLVQFLVLSSIQ